MFGYCIEVIFSLRKIAYTMCVCVR